MDKEFPHYYICDDCAKNKYGKLKHHMGQTVVKRICPYCELPIEQFLTPIVDFVWQQPRPASGSHE